MRRRRDRVRLASHGAKNLIFFLAFLSFFFAADTLCSDVHSLRAIECLPADVLDKIEIVAVSLTKDERGELGIYVKGKLDNDGTLGYVIADFEVSNWAA